MAFLASEAPRLSTTPAQIIKINFEYFINQTIAQGKASSIIEH